MKRQIILFYFIFPLFGNAQNIEQNITLKQPKGSLNGVLLSPQTTKKFPLVLIIAGSGPTDGDGNSIAGVKANSYKMIAEELAKKGIASFRYDKRGIGNSKNTMTKESDLVFDTYVQDACQWIDTLVRTNKFSQIVILGHSEGSLIGMIAAQNRKVDKYVSLAGAGRPIDEIINEQVQNQSTSLPDSVVKEISNNLSLLKKGQIIPKLMQNFVVISLFRTSIQPFMISWLKYNPTDEIKKVKIPTMIIQGTTDIQVPLSDAQLLSKAKPEAKFLVIEGMNHVLKDAPADKTENAKTYLDQNLPLSKRLIEGIVDFIKR
jgi:uncharacterized protein